jgi:hypothetical protein
MFGPRLRGVDPDVASARDGAGNARHGNSAAGVRIQLVIGIARINGAWPFSPRPAIGAAARDWAALLVLNNLRYELRLGASER